MKKLSLITKLLLSSLEIVLILLNTKNLKDWPELLMDNLLTLFLLKSKKLPQLVNQKIALFFSNNLTIKETISRENGI
jgi:hypothetical protein